MSAATRPVALHGRADDGAAALFQQATLSLRAPFEAASGAGSAGSLAGTDALREVARYCT